MAKLNLYLSDIEDESQTASNSLDAEVGNIFLELHEETMHSNGYDFVANNEGSTNSVSDTNQDGERVDLWIVKISNEYAGTSTLSMQRIEEYMENISFFHALWPGVYTFSTPSSLVGRDRSAALYYLRDKLWEEGFPATIIS